MATIAALSLGVLGQQVMTAVPAGAAPLPPEACVAKYGDTTFISVYGTAQDINNQPEMDAVYNHFSARVTDPALGAAKETTIRVPIEYNAPSFDALADKLVYPLVVLFSLNQGVGALRDRVTQIRDECPRQAFVVAGYSLGAWIVNDWLRYHWLTRPVDPLDPEASGDLEGVALFGDPQWRRMLTPEEIDQQNGPHAPRRVFEGLAADFGFGFQPYPVQLPNNNLQSWCASMDPICGEGYYRVAPQTAAAADCEPLVNPDCPHFAYKPPAAATPIEAANYPTTHAANFLADVILNDAQSVSAGMATSVAGTTAAVQ